MVRRNTGFGQRDDVDRRIPNGRETRLNPEILRIIDKQPGEIFLRLGVNWIFLRVTQRTQGNQRVQHRWKDRGETVTSLADAFEHPALGCLQRTPSQRTNAQRLQKFEGIIESEKEIAPRPELFAARKPQIALLGAERIELMQLFFARKNPTRLEVIDDGERDDHGPAP